MATCLGRPPVGGEPSPVLVAEMLDALKDEEEGFDADYLCEEANPT